MGSVSLENPDTVAELGCHALLISAALVSREAQVPFRGQAPTPQDPVLPSPLPQSPGVLMWMREGCTG